MGTTSFGGPLVVNPTAASPGSYSHSIYFYSTSSGGSSVFAQQVLDPRGNLILVPGTGGVVSMYGPIASSGDPPVASACGVSPSIATGSNSVSGTVVLGSGAPSACTLTLAYGGSTCTATTNSPAIGVAITAASGATVTFGFSAAATGLGFNYTCIL